VILQKHRSGANGASYTGIPILFNDTVKNKHIGLEQENRHKMKRLLQGAKVAMPTIF